MVDGASDEDVPQSPTRVEIGFDVRHATTEPRRCTAHLYDSSLLRGTTSAVLLNRFGSILKSTAGGIGLAHSGEDSYTKSEVASGGQLDIFLSHSWHACWWKKYLTLLYYFNALPATVSVILVAIFWSAVQLQPCGAETRGTRWRAFGPTSLVFFVVLFSWHHVRAFYRRNRCLIFLDKVCIDQKNPERKTEGIKAIGGILHESRMLLVAWDQSYFTRLWCTFELAAFYHSQPEGKVVLLPIILGRVTSEIALISWLMEFLRAHIETWQRNLALFFVSLAFASRFHDFLMEVDILSDELARFSAQNAKCFCCSNSHRHPVTLEVLSCDRKLVNHSIAHWYGNGIGNVQEGLARFDELIRGQLRQQIREVIRGARIPYHFVLVSSVWPAMHQLDLMQDCRTSPWARVIQSIHIMFVSFPLVFAMMMAVMRVLTKWPRLNKCCSTVIFALTNCGLHWVSIRCGRLLRLASSPTSSWLHVLLCIVVLLGEAVLVFVFFLNGNTMQLTRRLAERVTRRKTLAGPRPSAPARGAPAAAAVELVQRSATS